MMWTHDTPTVEGYYWLAGRYDGVESSEEPTVVRVMSYGHSTRDKLYVLWPGDDYDEPVSKLPKTAWWMGPISPPAPPGEEEDEDQWSLSVSVSPSPSAEPDEYHPTGMVIGTDADRGLRELAAQMNEDSREEYCGHMRIGEIVEHPDGFKVKVISGRYLDAIYGRVTNWWTWRRVNDDGSLGEEEKSYGW